MIKKLIWNLSLH